VESGQGQRGRGKGRVGEACGPIKVKNKRAERRARRIFFWLLRTPSKCLCVLSGSECVCVCVGWCATPAIEGVEPGLCTAATARALAHTFFFLSPAALSRYGSDVPVLFLFDSRSLWPVFAPKEHPQESGVQGGLGLGGRGEGSSVRGVPRSQQQAFNPPFSPSSSFLLLPTPVSSTRPPVRWKVQDAGDRHDAGAAWMGHWAVNEPKVKTQRNQPGRAASVKVTNVPPPVEPHPCGLSVSCVCLCLVKGLF
jgi:hypothetical protein